MGFVFCFFCFPSIAMACTSILVTKGASKTGATMISYSCDSEFHPHLRLKPAADHLPGTTVKVGNKYGKKGEIPQAAHTYRTVGLMNQHQLAIGETTFGGRKELLNKEGLLHYSQLIRLVSQRAKTARQAIDVLVDLVEKYGYGSTGESFSIADKNEIWIMEMVGPGPAGKGALWVAIRLPDGSVAAHANMSRIHYFPLNDPENARYAKNVISFAVQRGYYDPGRDGRFSFSKAYNPPSHEQVKYSDRRVWSIFRRIAPSLALSPDRSSHKKGLEPYPLYIKPDKKLDVRDVIALHRDHYEGTPFDMTRDQVAGPFGSPDRYRPMKFHVDGKTYSWERPIATQQTAFVYVSESRAHVSDVVGGVNWYGLDNPYTNFFVPLYTSISRLPESYEIGELKRFSRDSAWWALNLVANYTNLRYRYMIKDVQKVQQEIEDLAFDLQPAIEKVAMALARTQPSLVSKFLTKYCVENAEMNVRRWWKLSEHLITKYNDGYIQNAKGRPEEVGYPQPWLKKETDKNGDRMRLEKASDDQGER
jgi:dipeptidase